MISIFAEFFHNSSVQVLVIIAILGYAIFRSKFSLFRFISFLITSIAVVAVIHPGATKPYHFYIVGAIAHYGEYIAPHRPVIWGRTEFPSLAQGEVKRPNVIIILADDLGYNDLSGGAGVQTPHIDALKSSGVSFSQAYSGHATCSPARASLLTGRFPSRFGFEYTSVHWLFAWALSRPDPKNARQPIFHYDLLRKVPDEFQMRCPTSEMMISNALKTVNYSTVYIGKWHLGERKEVVPESRGFDETLSFLRGASKYYPTNHPDVVNAPLDDPMDEFLFDNLGGNVRHNGTARFPPLDYLTDYFGIQAANAIKTKLTLPESDSLTVPPLLMVVAFNAPHTPLQARRSDYDSPELQHIKGHTERVYAAMIKSLDRNVGRITTAVQESGQADNTIIIFTSDNGGPAYVGIQDMNKPLRGWKATFFEGGFRVPMYLSWPSVIPAGLEYERPVSHVDIFVTAAIAGGVDMEQLRQDRVYDGVDLMPHLSARIANLNAHCDVDGGDTCTTAVPEEDPHSQLYWRTGSYIATRVGNYKMQVSHNPDRVWISDIVNDLHEDHNLVHGLRWSVLSVALHSTQSEDQCLSAVSSQQINLTIATSYIRHACELGRQLLMLDAQQAEPLWPGLVEVPVPVDTPSLHVTKENEEYVYWTN